MESRLTPAREKPAKFSASAEVGLASKLTSRSSAKLQYALKRPNSAATVSGGIKEGVPPPKNTEVRPRPLVN